MFGILGDLADQPGSSPAQEQNQAAEREIQAKEEFDIGKAAYEARDYKTAAAHFDRAYDLSGDNDHFSIYDKWREAARDQERRSADQACAALGAYNMRNQQLAQEWKAYFAQSGVENVPPVPDEEFRRHPRNCEKLVPVLQRATWMMDQLSPLYRNAMTQCPQITREHALGADPEQSRSSALQYLAICGQPAAVPASLGAPTPAANDAAPQRAVSERCITYEAPHVWGRTPDDSGRGWVRNYVTHVKPVRAPGCPKHPSFVYREPNGQISGPYDAPFMVQTVGAPPTDIHVEP
jgi:tetratricopeptide (TPR) repeat protein